MYRAMMFTIEEIVHVCRLLAGFGVSSSDPTRCFDHIVVKIDENLVFDDKIELRD